MFNLFFQISALLGHLLSARTKYYMHSPFVYNLLVNVLEKKEEAPEFLEIINFRNKLKSSTDKSIVFKGIGAIHKEAHKSLQEIEKRLSVPHRIGKRYFHCIQKFEYQTILEIGTCVGIGTMYLAKANAQAQVFTLEGNKDCSDSARLNFQALHLNNISIIEGLFEDTLAATLQKMKRVDMVVIDGNHQYESTLSYFKLILPFIHEDSLIVIDDIHWSKEMYRAWQEIIDDQQVSLALDFYRNGFIFFKKNRLEKETFKIWVSD